MLFLLFQLDEERYALDASAVSEVLPLLPIRPIPRTPPAMAGVLSYRGLTVPVVDLCELALARPAEPRTSTRIVLVTHPHTGGEGRLLGLIAERVTRTFQAEAALFKPAGVNVGEARYLGPVASGPEGLVQRIEVGELLTPALSAALFDSVVEP